VYGIITRMRKDIFLTARPPRLNIPKIKKMRAKEPRERTNKTFRLVAHFCATSPKAQELNVVSRCESNLINYVYASDMVGKY
jgi:hypothetical protein